MSVKKHSHKCSYATLVKVKYLGNMTGGATCPAMNHLKTMLFVVNKAQRQS